MTRNSLINLMIVTVVILSAWGIAETAGEPFPGGNEISSSTCRLYSREVTERYYTLTARVRLLLFWISRPGIGAGRITWSEGDDGTRGLALLIGSDPARAPMRINRWGYIAERVSKSCADLVGVMTEAEEQSIEQARASIARSNADHSFKAIRAQIQDGTAQSSVSYIKLAEDFTYRDVDTLLERVPRDGARIRRLSVPEGAEPGFLFAVRSLVRDSVDSYRRGGASGVAQQALRRYVFSGSLFEVRRQSTRVVRELVVNGSVFRQLLESYFETRNFSNGQLSHFSITYGIQDPINGIPVRIVYRPHWWFEAEMLLDGDTAASQVAKGGEPWKSGAN
jgi:hypothetical protein